MKVFDKVSVSNPKDHSIWIGGKKSDDSEFVEAMIEHRITPGSATAAGFSTPPGNRWMTGSECGERGFERIEIPPKSTIVVLLPARTKSLGADIAEFRMPYTSDNLASRASRSGFAEIVHEILLRLGAFTIEVPLRPPLERLSDEADRVVDHRLPSPKPTKP